MRNLLLVLTIFGCVGTLTVGSVFAQDEEEEIWEYSPYRVNIWIGVDESPVITDSIVADVAQRLEWSAEQADLSGWIVDAEPAPAEYRFAIARDIDNLTLPEEKEALKEFQKDDKRMFVSIRQTGVEFEVAAREYDCRTGLWGPVARSMTQHRAMIGHIAYRMLVRAFLPVVRIEDVLVDMQRADARVRAAGFHQNAGFGSDGNSGEQSPIWVRDDDVFLPMIRRLTKSGDLSDRGIRFVDWTFLTVKSRNGVMVTCDIHSGVRTPLGGRSSRRTEKLAVVVRPTVDTTTLVLESRDDPPKPLQGYEVYSKYPGSEESELLGKTDWQGSLEITTGDHPLRRLLVRSGSRNLAILPMVPGQYAEQSAAMFNDSVRRRAEGILKGLETEFLILVARRELLATRVRMKLAQNDMDYARQLYEELRSLTSLDQFQAKVDSSERMLTTDDTREQRRITAMFNQLRRLVTEHLSQDIVTPTAQEIDKMEKQGGGFGRSGTPAE